MAHIDYDNTTSREALDAFQPVSGKLDDQIRAALAYAGMATCQRVEEMISRDHQAVSGNLRHMVERGEVRWAGTFGKTKSGRRARHWELVPKQTDLLFR